MTSAKLDNRALPHTLLAGPAGLGKTTFARAIAQKGEYEWVEATPDSIKTPELAARLFTKFPADGYTDTGEKVGTIRPIALFIDEAHNLPRKSQEILGVAMETFNHTYTVKRGKHRDLLTTWVPEFTVICATTDEGKLIKMFRDRLKQLYYLKTYTMDEATKIVIFHADRLKIDITKEAVKAIAKRGRGTPRIMVRYLEQSRDYANSVSSNILTEDIAEKLFSLIRVDNTGLTETDTNILKYLYELAEEPIGLDNLAISLGASKTTLAEVNEPHLILRGLMARTGRGRIITEAGTKYLASKGLVKASKDNTAPNRVIRTSKVD